MDGWDHLTYKVKIIKILICVTLDYPLKLSWTLLLQIMKFSRIISSTSPLRMIPALWAFEPFYAT